MAKINVKLPEISVNCLKSKDLAQNGEKISTNWISRFSTFGIFDTPLTVLITRTPAVLKMIV